MIKLLSHLLHVRLAAADVAASVAFYRQRLGMHEAHRDASAVYLRTSDDYYLYSLVIERGPEPALVSMAWRTVSDASLTEAAHRVEAAGVQGRWHERSFGHGRSFSFTGPWGHTMELFSQGNKFHAPEPLPETDSDADADSAPATPSPAIEVRQLDHVSVAAPDVSAFLAWHEDVLGLQVQQRTVLDQERTTVFAVLGTTDTAHDLGVLLDSSDRPGRMNHMAYRVDTRAELFRAAPALDSVGVRIEHGPSTHLEFGASMHAIGEQNYLYLRDPSGMRVEINTGGFLRAVPDATPAFWRPGPGLYYRNARMPLSMTESFPPDAAPSATEEGLVFGTEARLITPAIARHTR
ncbi:hypothetical protein GY21_04740 [Cryobacterium roopkundense]|uniref:Catechol 2,3-dioxygenase n=1 Tax=Cryobacterium roopkundense TaxID=1001240 RepID=A0A099JMQ9_9MICO|nr:VOC family protein [Cryobacterium roopkundense]KGJ79639.1 hypothetical protein GY21_04740 [Cryobacterium roopkundense]MBB5639776.1 catechol 2,3-dioxygenase [Cryobacterium roopkundense]